MEKVLELAKKLKALAERGIGGEKTNAIAALKALLKKHNISTEELDDPITKSYRIYVPFKKRKIFLQIYQMVVGRGQEMYILRAKPNTYVQELTAAQFVELEATFEFYWNAYQKELEIFEDAFIQRNSLFDPDGPKKDLADLSPEEQARAMKMFAIASNIEKQNMSKRIEA